MSFYWIAFHKGKTDWKKKIDWRTFWWNFYVRDFKADKKYWHTPYTQNKNGSWIESNYDFFLLLFCGSDVWKIGFFDKLMTICQIQVNDWMQETWKLFQFNSLHFFCCSEHIELNKILWLSIYRPNLYRKHGILLCNGVGTKNSW